jgi:hypothetical protein
LDSNLSLIGSAILGSIFLLGLMRFYMGVTDYTHEQTFQLFTQQNATVMMQIVEDDVRKMGSGVAAVGNSIGAFPDSANITFKADIDGNGTADNVQYYISPTSAASMTPNPNDRFLIRDINSGASIDSLLGVSEFCVELQNQWGQKIVTGTTQAGRDSTWIVKIKMIVVSPHPYTQDEVDGPVYTRSFAEKTIMPKNLFRFTANNL